MGKFFKRLWEVLVSRLTCKIKFLIIDFDKRTGTFTFLCYGGRAFFKKKLLEVMLDKQLISGLHTEQACFVGLMYGMWVKENRFSYSDEQYQRLLKKHSYDMQSDSGIVFDRKGNIIYFDKKSGKPNIVNAYAVASTRTLINQFSPLVACEIGSFVGSGIAKPVSNELDQGCSKDDAGKVLDFKAFINAKGTSK